MSKLYKYSLTHNSFMLEANDLDTEMSDAEDAAVAALKEIEIDINEFDVEFKGIDSFPISIFFPIEEEFNVSAFKMVAKDLCEMNNMNDIGEQKYWLLNMHDLKEYNQMIDDIVLCDGWESLTIPQLTFKCAVEHKRIELPEEDQDDLYEEINEAFASMEFVKVYWKAIDEVIN